jgi:D-lactate dehydrogenase (cytochrome)
MNAFQPVTEPILAALTGVVTPVNISTAEAERLLRAQDMSQHEARMSEVVVWPTTAQQVADVLNIAKEQRIPVTPWGAGSSLEGNPIPLYGGISLSMERMNAVIAIHDEDFQVTVQPGIGYKDLNEKLARHGLFFAPDPGANASIGGMLANNAAGSRTVKYGATKDNVLAMEVALADGRLIHVGSRSIKQASGYDLLHLFIGSEGTLGVTTAATLKLAPLPTVMSSVLARFPSVETAVATVIEIRSSGLDVAALEFIDGKTAAMVTREGEADWGETPVLLMEIHAAHAEAAELDLALIQEICEELGATSFQATTNAAQRKQMWHARHHLFEMKIRLFLHDLDGNMIGHAGDGNLHVELPYKDEVTRQRALLANEAIVTKAIELDGTCTGEHGVGIGKAKFMELEHGTAVDVMRSLKQTLDPRGILNPGKIFV